MLGKEHLYIYIYIYRLDTPQLKRQGLGMDSDWHVETEKKIISREKNRMCISLGYENECGKGWLHCKFHKELKTWKAIHRDYMLKNNNVSSEGLDKHYHKYYH